jgi:hypothetical protein
VTRFSTTSRSTGDKHEGVSASRLYWEYKGGFFNVKGASIPVAVSVVPGEQYQAPRSWAEQANPNLIYFNEVEKAVTSPPGAAGAVRERAPRRLQTAANERRPAMSTVETATQIRPFHLEITEDQIDDLRRRIAATRWPSKELVDDRSQGVQLATLKALADYWTSEYDFGRVEARLTLPQFTTEIDGVEIHFIHVRSQHEDALPLVMTHGWPGSVIELLETIGPLTDPIAHGEPPRMRSTSCCRRCRATASRPSRPRSAGTRAASRRRGRS